MKRLIKRIISNKDNKNIEQNIIHSRLKKIADGDMSAISPTLVIKDFEQKIDNENPQKIQYGPNISREWKFEEPIDYAEWNLMDNN